jgi:hypothetical protein
MVLMVIDVDMAMLGVNVKPVATLREKASVASTEPNGRWETGPLVDWRDGADTTETVPGFEAGNRGDKYAPVESNDDCFSKKCGARFFRYPDEPAAESFVSPLRPDGTRRRGYGRLLPGRSPEMPVDLTMIILSVCTELGAEKRAALRMLFPQIDTDLYRVSYYWGMSSECFNHWLDHTHNETTAQLIRQENATYGDIWYFPDEIPNNELSSKMHHEYKYHVARRRTTYFFKVDDDIVVIWKTFMEALYAMPRQGVAWFRQGTGRQGIYANGPYLVSLDVAAQVAADDRISGGRYDDDWRIGTSITGSGSAFNIVFENRWHNDDLGDPKFCLCFPFTVATVESGKTMLAHHVKPKVIRAWATNKTEFMTLWHPHRNYAMCEQAKTDPSFICR